jgi:hypothetical protein
MPRTKTIVCLSNIGGELDRVEMFEDEAALEGAIGAAVVRLVAACGYVMRPGDTITITEEG